MAELNEQATERPWLVEIHDARGDQCRLVIVSRNDPRIGGTHYVVAADEMEIRRERALADYRLICAAVNAYDPDATHSQVSAAGQDDALHLAVCQAVALLNNVIHKQDESRQAHDILRQALVDRADAEVSERTKLIRQQQRSGGKGATAVMVSHRPEQSEVEVVPSLIVTAEWVISHFNGRKDHACAECIGVYDGTSTAIDGFQCVFHRALYVKAFPAASDISAARPPTSEVDSRIADTSAHRCPHFEPKGENSDGAYNAKIIIDVENDLLSASERNHLSAKPRTWYSLLIKQLIQRIANLRVMHSSARRDVWDAAIEIVNEARFSGDGDLRSIVGQLESAKAEAGKEE